MKSVTVLLLAIIFILPAFSGCKKGAAPQKAEVQKVEKIEVKPETLTEETSTVSEGYLYAQVGRRDPFKPLIEVKKKTPVEEQRVMGTLESYDITDFSVVAIIKKGYKYYAQLVAPDNKAFTVEEGTIIGLHKGKVEKILDDKVIIVEYTKDYKGDLKPRDVALELHKEG